MRWVGRISDLDVISGVSKETNVPHAERPLRITSSFEIEGIVALVAAAPADSDPTAAQQQRNVNMYLYTCYIKSMCVH